MIRENTPFTNHGFDDMGMRPDSGIIHNDGVANDRERIQIHPRTDTGIGHNNAVRPDSAVVANHCRPVNNSVGPDSCALSDSDRPLNYRLPACSTFTDRREVFKETPVHFQQIPCEDCILPVICWDRPDLLPGCDHCRYRISYVITPAPGKKVFLEGIYASAHHEARGVLRLFNNIGYQPFIQEDDTEIGGIRVFFNKDCVGNIPDSSYRLRVNIIITRQDKEISIDLRFCTLEGMSSAQ